jgi:S1-C subfamily serine protease
MARILAALVAVILASCAAGTSSDLRHYTVALSSSPDRDNIYCSGTIIDKTGGILTASHCTQGLRNSGDTVYVILYSGEIYPAHFSWAAKTADLALVRIDGSVNLGIEAPIAENQPFYIGQEVSTVGMTMGFEWIHTYGRISSDFIRALDYPEFGNWMVLDITAGPGNSGGAIFNEDGEVIGILVAMVPPRLPVPIPVIGPGSFVFAVPLDVIHRMLPV